jgi:hypothetical protein
MSLFIAQIQGQNGSPAHAHAPGEPGCERLGPWDGPTGRSVVALTAAPRGFDWSTIDVTVDVEDDVPEFLPALFESRQAARAAAEACHWSNQRFRVVAARGNARARGRIVRVTGEWMSCQETSG